VLELEKEDIDQIKRNVEPMHAADPRDREGDPEPALAETRVIELDVEGRFGTDLYPIAFEKVIEYAERREIRHLVLVFDTQGGEVWAAWGSLQTLQDRPAWMNVYAIVRRAEGVGAWPLIASDEIYVTPRAVLGGDSTLHPEHWADADSRATYNRARADVVNEAQMRGYPEELVKQLANVPLRDDEDSPQVGMSIDSANVVLTSSDAIEAGLAEPVQRLKPDEDAVGLLGRLVAYDVIGAASSRFRTVNRTARRMDREITNLWSEMPGQSDVRRMNPSSGSRSVDDDPDNERNDALAVVRRFRGMLERSERLGLDAKWRVPAVEDRVRIAWRALQDD